MTAKAAERLIHRLHRRVVDQNDAKTRAVFGEYVSVYDIQQANTRNCLHYKS